MLEDIVSEAEQLDEASALVEQLAAKDDPRGELLQLEIASVRASSVEQARAHAAAAQELRLALADRVWPAPLMATDLPLRAGFVVYFDQVDSKTPFLDEVATLPAMSGVRELGHHLLQSIAPTIAHMQPAVVETSIESSLRIEALEILTKMRGLVGLELHVQPEQSEEAMKHLAAREDLRGLTLGALQRLATTGLTHLSLASFDPADLDLLAALPRLRHLEFGLHDRSDTFELDRLERLGSLDSLALWHGAMSSQAWAAVGRLSLCHLDLSVGQDPSSERPRWHEGVLGQTLESLVTDLEFVEPERLCALPKLRRLELWGFPPEDAAVRLPELERLSIDDDLLPSIPELHCTELVLSASDPPDWRRLLDLGVEAGSPAGVRALSLYELGPPLSDVALRVLGGIEHLQLHATPSQRQAEQLRELPRLRRLTVGCDPVEHRELCALLPSILVESTQLWPRASQG